MVERPFAPSPAQIKFLQNCIPAFSADSWAMTIAGEAGSDRRFVRVAPMSGLTETPRVMVLWDSRDPDWQRLLDLTREFKGITRALPEIVAIDDRHGLILEEDLGCETLRRHCEGASLEQIEQAYRGTLDALLCWQRIDPMCSSVIRSRALDFDVFTWETSYFAKHCVTEYCGCEQLLDARWERERVQLATLVSAFAQVAAHRDFQSENIMLSGGQVRFVDVQGARLGPAGYDLASLLFDPYENALTQPLVRLLFDYYAAAGGAADYRSFMLCGLQRLMQALGAYTNLSLHKGKERYRVFVPVALERLRALLDECGEFPALRAAVECCIERVSRIA